MNNEYEYCYRTGTHSHVLRLLSKGGARPRLLVSQQPPIWDAPEYAKLDGGHTHSDNTYAHLLPDTRIGTVEDQSRIFRRKVLTVLYERVWHVLAVYWCIIQYNYIHQLSLLCYDTECILIISPAR